MMSAASAIRFDLPHPATFLSHSPELNGLIVADEDGHISICQFGNGSISTRLLDYRISAIAAHPTQPIIALLEQSTQQLIVMDHQGRPVSTHDRVPLWADEQFARHAINGCLFDKWGKYLWVSSPGSIGHVSVEIFDVNAWRLLAREEIYDETESFWHSLHATPLDGTQLLWSSGGFDGYEISHELRYIEGRVKVDRILRLDDAIGPSFSPSGRHVLGLYETGRGMEARFLGMPDYATISTMAKDLVGVEPGYRATLLDDTVAIVSERYEDRIFAIDFAEQKLIGKLPIELPEPKPIYDNQGNKLEMKYTGLGSFEAAGDRIAFFHASLYSDDKIRISLITYTFDQLLAEIRVLNRGKPNGHF